MSAIKISDVIKYIEHTTSEERSKIVTEFLRDMNTLAQSAINLFEKNRIALTLYDIAFEFRVVDYSDNSEIIGVKHGFPANGTTLAKYLITLLEGKSNGMEQSGTSQDESTE